MRTTPQRLVSARTRGEAGQGVLEYLGMVLLVAVVVAVAIFAANRTLGPAVVGMVHDLFEKAVGVLTSAH